jgi:hypothetical protein
MKAGSPRNDKDLWVRTAADYRKSLINPGGQFQKLGSMHWQTLVRHGLAVIVFKRSTAGLVWF